MSEIEIRSLNGYKLVDETAREMIANGVGSSVQSDWNVNDENDPAYVRNRTHYSNFQEKELFNQEIVFDSDGKYESTTLGGKSFLENKDFVTVTYDNIQYTCSVHKFFYVFYENTYAIGNSDMLNETIGPEAGIQFPTENTDMPFYMLVVDYNGYLMIVCHGTEGTHSVKIDGIEETILKIDEKYLPPLVGKEGPGKGDVIFNDYVHNKISAGGSYNFVEGYANRITSAGAAHVEGYQNIADHSYTHAEGRGGLVRSQYSHIEGDGYFFAGTCTLTFLENERVEFKTSYKTLDMLNYPNHYCFFIYDDDSNFAETIHPDTIIEYSQSDEGLSYIYEYYYNNSELTGKTFNARLMVHIAGGDGATHVEGQCNIGHGNAQHVQGRYNLPEEPFDNRYAHMVGNGRNANNRSNAHTLDWQGNAWYSGDVYVGSTSGTNKDEGSKKLATEEYVAEEIANIGNTLALHPIGSIYMSVNETSPAELFGGTWEQLKNRFLLGTSDAHPLGEEGGSETHTLTESELPKISGTISLGNGASGEADGGYGAVRTASGAFKGSVKMQYGRPSAATSAAYASDSTSFRDAQMNFGGGQAHNNMPPYIAVNIWKRVA